MVCSRSFLSLFTISIITTGALAGDDDDSHLFDYDVLQYVDPLIGSAEGGMIDYSPWFVRIGLTICRQCLRRRVHSLRHGQSRCRYRFRE